MEQKRNQSSEEIDLLYFFRPAANIFKRVWTFALDYIKLLAHNRLLFAAILLLGTLAGYCLRYVIPPAYKTEAIFISDMIPGRYCTNLLQNLNELRRPKNIPELARTLNISTDAAWQIQGIIPTATQKDTFVVEKRDSSMWLFRVTLIMHDMQHLEEIQNGLIYYLENNEYVRKRKAARLKNLITQREDLISRVRSLDSVKTLVNSSVVSRNQGQGIILGEPINPVSIYQAEVSYLRDRLNIEERIATIDNIELLQPFLKLSEYNHPNYDKLMNYAFAAAFLFGLVVVALIGRKPKNSVRDNR
ncbi:MAG: hypothetical protein WCF67_04705 [Chitinophagaceae bacterium]